MAASNFAPSLALVLTYEGGFVDDPHDPGGATCYGVTLDTLSDWRGRRCSVAEVRELTRADVSPIYAKRYWAPVFGDQLPAGVDLLVFDAAVNQGPGAAAKMLQRAAYVTADGNVGPATLQAVAGCKPADLIGRLRAERASAYRAAAGWPTFGAGWMRRLESVSATATSWAVKAAQSPATSARLASALPAPPSHTVEVDL